MTTPGTPLEQMEALEAELGPGELWLEYVPVDDLRPDPRNPKNHAERDLDASMVRFGFTEPIQVDERTGLLVSGHGRRGRVIAARDRGDAAPPGVKVDEAGRWCVPLVRGWRSRDDDEALAYLLAANLISQKGGWHDRLLAPELEHLASTSGGLEGVGIDHAEMAALIESVSAATATPPAEFRKVDENIATEHECPRCHYTWSGSTKPQEPDEEPGGAAGGE